MKAVIGKSLLFFFLLGIYFTVLAGPASKPQVFYLDDCIRIGIEQSKYHKIANSDIKIAKARQGQAKSAYWPDISASSLFSILDQDLNFIFPGIQVNVPPIQILSYEMEIPPVDIPEQNIKLLDRKNIFSLLNMTLPLYTGGYISSMNKQAQIGYDIAHQDLKGTDLQIKYDITKSYYSCLLSNYLFELGTESLIRLETTLDLIENLYLKGSGRVKKTDYYKNKIIVDNLRSWLYMIEENKDLSYQALQFYMGYDLTNEKAFALPDTEICFQRYHLDEKELLSAALVNNPQWNKINFALELYKAKINEMKSDYYPQIAAMGNLGMVNNSYDKGLFSRQNKDYWSIGIGMTIPVFNGFRTHHKIKQSHAEFEKINFQKQLFESGLSLQINTLINKLRILQKRLDTLNSARLTAIDNRDLTEKAYHSDLMEQQDLLESQIYESLMKAQYHIVLYQYVIQVANLEMLIGINIH